jgi:hypothetical protein
MRGPITGTLRQEDRPFEEYLRGIHDANETLSEPAIDTDSGLEHRVAVQAGC